MWSGRAAAVLWALAALAGTARGADGTDGDWGKFAVDGRRSGYTYAAAETRAIQDDDFDNPGSLWLSRGESLWQQTEGHENKACASCHGQAETSMRGVGARYPVYAKEAGRLLNVEQRINQCRTERMGATAWPSESEALLAMTAYVKHQSFMLPVAARIDGDAAPFFARGKAIYLARRGQLDLACSDCHERNHGRLLRANRLSEGMSNGFPLYRLKWQTLASLQRRIVGCMNDVRAEPYPEGAEEYVDLELYLAWRARGLPVETPAVRN